MKILLDTHTFLWWIIDAPKLSSRARKIISSSENELFLSAVSGWEIIIKAKLGRLQLHENPAQFILEQIRLNFIQILTIQMSHALHISTLPDLHRDPFDRMLIAQAQLEGLPILTADSQIARYKVEVIW
jgi:PIN domain nuclease of toxin-antitoxin system